MDEKMKPYAELISMIKDRTKYSDRMIEEIIREGKQRLAEQEKRELLNQADLFKRVYGDELPADLSRKLRDLKKLQLADFRNNERSLNLFSMYCRCINEGFRTQLLDPDKSENIINDLSAFRVLVERYVHNETSSASGSEEKGDITDMDIQIVKLNEVLESFMDEMNTIHDESTWEELDGHGEYDRFVVIRKQATLMFTSDYGDAAFRILEAPLEKVVYVASMEPMDDGVEVAAYPCMEEALSSVFACINSEFHDYRLDSLSRTYTKTYDTEGAAKVELYAYDTKSSLTEKVARLLS